MNIGDRVEASDKFIKEYILLDNWDQELYNATKNNETITVKRIDSDSVVIYCESFTSPTKTWTFYSFIK